MDGLIAKISAVPGQRDALIAILAAGSASMPGCLSYVVFERSEDESGIWITEMWDSETKSHGVVDTANRQGGDHQGRPLIARFGPRYVTTAIGGRWKRGNLAVPTAIS
jgi:quinol monooxygenase YgiN